jgi:hypothetical protein
MAETWRIFASSSTAAMHVECVDNATTNFAHMRLSFHFREEKALSFSAAAPQKCAQIVYSVN